MSVAASKLLRALGVLTALAADGKLKRQCLWRLLGGALDAFTIGVSVADIITDVLVLVEFRENGYDAFFGGSLAIFALAQMSYAFLFAATYASHCSASRRVAVFLLVLPLAQLVPVFAWLEAMHLARVDAALRALGLQPTAEAPAIADSGDSLWGFLQSKYQSHAGFLVEAFVEAVPQAVLQTAFVVVAHRSSTLNAVSVAISVFTIASKGYLVSYALDVATFLFNFLCIAADSFGLFACTTLLVLRGLGGGLSAAFVALSAAGLALSVASGHGLLWFILLDDHLKLRHPQNWPQGIRGIRSVFFDIYVVRIMAWLLALVPCVVLFAGARLSLLPVCILRSIDPDLVCHARFYRGLVRFLHGTGGGAPGLEARLWTANAFLARARSRKGLLVQRLGKAAAPAQRLAIVQRWAVEVGTPEPLQGVYIPTSWRHVRAAREHREEEDDAVQRAILESLAAAQRAMGEQAGTAAHLRAQIRRLRAAAWIESRARYIWQELQDRSEVFRNGLSCSGGPVDCLLKGLAVVALAAAVCCAVPLVLTHTALVLLGIVFPVIHAVPTCSASSSAEEAMPCGLAVSYCAMLLCSLTLAPCVARRQLLWAELTDLHGFPDAFYGGAVLAELRKRHLRDSMLRQRLGHFVAQHTLAFLEK